MSRGKTGWIAATVAVVAWVITVARSTCSERHGRLLHRLLHQEPDGSWTWRVRGAKVPATRTTDVCLPIEPGAAEHYCPDCLVGAVRWDASGYVPRALECRDCGSQFVLACLRTEPAEQVSVAVTR